ncbi:MAG: RluA family pseudouridine synthase [Gemmatimonadetes bacterium]|nr:RluA family pseudouridine synthase [Gemmatimonadota bacterium]
MSGAEVRRERLVVGTADNARLDTYLGTRHPDLSRSRAVQLLEQGRVSVNGVVARKSHRLSDGDVIEIDMPAAEASEIAPESIPLVVVYEDEDLLVIDKPAGLVVHPAPGHSSGTLVNALLHHVQDLSGIGGVLRPGIVHRLDRDTSGLMIVAKNDAAHRTLSSALKRREVRRIYVAAVWGHLPQDTMDIDAPIGRARNDRKRMAVIPDGRAARTGVRRVARWRAADLVQAELESGRTHQIRVHLAHIGHPVVGDATYGQGAERGMSGPDRRWAGDLARRVPRQFLHAARLRFVHPRTGEELRFDSRLPPDLAAAAEWAEASTLVG